MLAYIDNKDKSMCYGCRACEQICPKKAIEMKSDEEGFIYPCLDSNKCVKCGLCKKVCPYEDTISENKELIKCYAIQHKSEDVLMESSSGGIFTLAADYILKQGGYVAGCIFDDNFNPIHILSNNKEEVNKMRGSKYVQSDIGNIYEAIENILKKGKRVLFTGTPCQVLGLKKFLLVEYKNLFTIDLICHGVPSSKLLQTYLNSEKEKGHYIDVLQFRNKRLNGWCSQGSIHYGSTTKRITPFNNSYYNLYLENSVSRYSCYTCKFASINRISDISIGDCWNICDEYPKIDASKGYSVAIINSIKGEKIFDSIKDKAECFELKKDFVIKNNSNLQEPSKMPENRVGIYERIDNEGYEKTTKKECHYQYIKPFVRKIIPRKVKKYLKNIRRKLYAYKNNYDS